MQVNYNYILETTHVSRVHNVAAVLYLRFLIYKTYVHYYYYYYYTIWMSLVTSLFFPVLLLNQR